MTALEFYAGKLRVRVVGILRENDSVLLINHIGLNPGNEFWHFPGGGVEKGENIENALKREFLEETGLDIKVGKFLKVNEHISDPLHAIELIFEVEKIGGILSLGQDPELNILKALQFFSEVEFAKKSKNKLASCIFELI
jgi:8-oxo-dGTP diphosphatase